MAIGTEVKPILRFAVVAAADTKAIPILIFAAMAISIVATVEARLKLKPVAITAGN